MIHIPSAGCGWAVSGGTYTCGELPKLDKVFQTTTITGTTIEGTTIAYDEFDHVPQHIEGFRMTLSPIIDMSGGTPSQLEVPELACRVDFDPFNAGTTSYVYNIDNPELTGNTNTQFTGFLDLYNQVDAYKDNFYVTVTEETITGSTSHMDDVFPTYTDTAVMGPGILEPMINTDFGEINVDMPPTPDLTVDAIIYSLVGLQGWRHAIDMRVNNLMINAADTGMENLEAAKNMAGPCTNFNIIAATGYPFGPVSIFGSTASVPTYSILSGTIYINKVPITVNGKANIAAPFYAYLDYKQDTNGVYAKIETTTGPQSPALGWKRVAIGSVLTIENNASTVRSPFNTGSSYRLYKINQGACIDELEYISGSTGYLYLENQDGGHRYKTDILLTSMDPIPDGQGYRGVQAQAISAYVEAHSGGDGRMYPDYLALSSGEDSVLSGIGVGITAIFPVKKNQHIGFRTDSTAIANCFVRYAPALGESEGTPLTLHEGEDAYDAQVAGADGFVRFSILDDGKHQGLCVRFLDNDKDWSHALPVYRFGDFHKPTPNYNGPFRVRITDPDTCTIVVDCPVCDNSVESLAGHYWLNGISPNNVGSATIDGSTQATTDIYAHVTGTTCIIDDQQITGATATPPYYTVWLAHVGEKTHTAASQEHPNGYWYNGTVTQVHHGDIYVDGRWQ